MKPGSTIGIIGGGQLGRMSALAAARLGYRAHIFAPEFNSPAAQVSAASTVAEYDHLPMLEMFARNVDVITFEFENLPAESLELLESLKPVRPGAQTLRLSQDRLLEKKFLNDAGIATAPWMKVETEEELTAAVAVLGLPAVLKTTRMGYDGKGQKLLTTADDLAPAFAELAPKPLILEGFIDFGSELSVMAARGVDGTIVAYDTVENRHKHHILDFTYAPAPVDPQIRAEAQAIARRIAEKLDLTGIMGVEFFLTAHGALLVNEIAPRPHNSGHWTIDACPCSQFEMHIRAVMGLPLPQPVRHSDAVMKNLVGPADIAQWDNILATPRLIPHHYGKLEAREGRKMGHVTRLFPKGSLPGEMGIEDALKLEG